MYYVMQILATYLAAAAAVLFGVAVHPPRKYESNYTDTRREITQRTQLLHLNHQLYVCKLP